MVISKLIFFLIFIKINSQNITIELEGSAIIENSLSSARNEAKKNAFILAIKTTLINISKNINAVKKLESDLDKTIYNNVENYIESFRALSEHRTQNNLKVSYAIILNINKLKADLIKYGISFDNKKIPKIIPFIAEKISSDNLLLNSLYLNKNSFTDIETNLFNNFLNKGIILLNPYETAIDYPNSNTFILLKVFELINYAKMHEADFVLSGYVYTSCNKDFNNKCNTLISLQVLNNDGALITSRRVNNSFTDSNYDQAYNKSREASIKTIADIVSNDLETYLQNKNNVFYNLRINKLSSYEHYMELKKIFDSQEIINIASIIDRYQSKNDLVFSVEVSNLNLNNSKNIIIKKLKEVFNINLEFDNEDIIINII